MKQQIIKSLLAVLATPLLLVSCNVETSDNGPLDGFWHLERIDTLATGGTTDYSSGYVFWGVQMDLIYIKDSSNSSVGAYYLRFNQWVRVTAKVGYKFHNIYRGKGPVLTAVSVEPAEKPLEDVVTFS